MLQRLGKVLYRLACIAAGLTVVIAVLLYATEGYAKKDGPGLTIVFLVIAFVIWLAGLALRYVLAGPSDTSTQSAAQNTAWADTYAERIYEALVEADHLGDMTPERLRLLGS
jgi:hypothetical protein